MELIPKGNIYCSALVRSKRPKMRLQCEGLVDPGSIYLQHAFRVEVGDILEGL